METPNKEINQRNEEFMKGVEAGQKFMSKKVSEAFLAIYKEAYNCPDKIKNSLYWTTQANLKICELRDQLTKTWKTPMKNIRYITQINEICAGCKKELPKGSDCILNEGGYVICDKCLHEPHYELEPKQTNPTRKTDTDQLNT